MGYLIKNNASIRSFVFIQDKEDGKISISFTPQGMEKSLETNLKFDKWQGVVGKCWGYGKPIAASLDNTKPDEYNLTPDQFLLTKDIKSVFANPIIESNGEKKMIGILSIDSTTDLSTVFSSEESRKFVGIMAGVIGYVLEANEIRKPLN